jgi:hypothetical protein
MLFSSRSVPICYKQGQLTAAFKLVCELETLVEEMLGFSRDLLLLKAGSRGIGSVRDPRGIRTLAAGNRYQVTASGLYSNMCV